MTFPRTFVPNICCDHVALAGKGWRRCPCGARCTRDSDGKIIEYSLDGSAERS
jgi:hypothetical protein